MKNLSKKIGVGVVASSLVVGGAVSTGLVANAESVKDAQVQQNQIANKLNDFGDLEFVKYAKDKYGFDVFGYYFADSSSDKHRMKMDIKDVVNDAKANHIKGYEKLEKFLTEDVEKLLIENPKSLLDFDFTYGKDFVDHLFEKGMQKGIKKIRIGDAIGIFVFKNEIQPEKYSYQDEDINKLNVLKSSNLQIERDIEENDHVKLLSDLSEFLK